jgi:hypothetical protein
VTNLRQGLRIVNPDPRTTENYTSPNLSIGVYMSLAGFNRIRGNIPASGPDTLTVTYSHQQGIPYVETYTLTLWMSDTGYIFISRDGLWQYLISGVNGPFFDQNAVTVNTRNTNASATALTACANASRYDYVQLLPNQVRPVTMIVDGNLYENEDGQYVYDPSANP